MNGLELPVFIMVFFFIFSSVWEHAHIIFDDKEVQSENHHQDLEELCYYNIPALAAFWSD